MKSIFVMLLLPMDSADGKLPVTHELQVESRTLDSTELAGFTAMPDMQFPEPGFTRGCALQDSFLFGDTVLIISLVRRDIYHHVREANGKIESKLVSSVAEGVFAIDFRKQSAKRLVLTGPIANQFHFARAFAWSPDTLGVLVRDREGDDHDVLWKWNPVTDEVAQSSQRSRV